MTVNEAYQLAVEALETHSSVGDTDLSKHDIFLMMQDINPDIEDTQYVIGRAINMLAEEGYIEQIGKDRNANLYERIK